MTAYRTAVVDVLPHQGEVLEDIESDTLIDVAGLGSGKSAAVVMKAVQLAGLNWPIPIGVYEPTYPMVRDILVPMFEEYLTAQDIAWRYNRQDHNLYVRMRGRDHLIMLRSTDNPASLKGPNLAAVIIDEAGSHKHDVWRHLPPRARHPKAPHKQFVAVGTPEGFNDFYDWAEGAWDESKRGRRHVVRAQTYDNIYLDGGPEEYIRRKLSHLDDVDLDQYVRGLFVARGSRVYRSFDRMQHGVPFTGSTAGRVFEVGADLNYGKTVWTVAVTGPMGGHVIGEVCRYDTTTEDLGEELSQYVQETVERHERRTPTIAEARRRTKIYLDPSAKSHTVRAHKSDVTTLREMGFGVECNHETIPVKDRVMSVNWRFRERALWVDTASCPELTRALEQQGRDKNGEPEKSRDPRQDLSGPVDSLGYWVWGHYDWRASVPRGNTAPAVGGYV